MQKTYALRDDQWEKIKDALPGKPGDPGRTAADNRLFIDAVMWVAKAGAPWRKLPPEYGKWPCVHRRFMRWAKNGVRQMIFNTLAADADTEWLTIDSTIVRAHRHSAGGEGGKKNRPSGGPGAGSARRHTPSRTPGGAPCASSWPAAARTARRPCHCLDGAAAGAAPADKGYDAGYIVDAVAAMGAEAVIPPRSNRREKRAYDRAPYRERNKIERMSGWLKRFRGIATRYAKLAVSFMSFVHLAAILLWLK